MHFCFLIEDHSSEVLIKILMQKLLADYPMDTYECRGFKGIGGLKKKSGIKDIKTGKLLTDLPIYLRGFDKSLKGFPAVIIVVLDNDDRDTETFRNALEKIVVDNHIDIDHVFCIAVEEVEAWLLGDKGAIRKAYPEARMSAMKNYEQDSICGTWEILADVVYPGGFKVMKKECPTFMEIGRYKAKWAENIGRFMDVDQNISPSFRFFVDTVRSRV